MVASLLMLHNDVLQNVAHLTLTHNGPVVSSRGLKAFAALASTCKRLWRVSLPSASYSYSYDMESCRCFAAQTLSTNTDEDERTCH